MDGAGFGEGSWKYVWMDVCSDDAALPPLAPDLVVVKAVPMFSIPEAAPSAFPLSPQEHIDWMVCV